MFDIPLYEGGRISANSAQAHYQQEKVTHDIETSVRDSRLAAGQAYLGVVNGAAHVKALELAVVANEVAL